MSGDKENSIEADIVVIGAGAAGMGLAIALENQHQKILFLDSHEAFTNDRTWCFWDRPDHDLTSITRHQWPSFRFHHENNEIIMDAPETPYQCIQAKDFYELGQRRINANQNSELIQGIYVDEICPNGACFDIITSKGVIKTLAVIDTRPPQKSDFKAPYMHQVFSGVEIETDEKAFDSKRADLMVHMTADSHGLGFIYVLPFSANRALVEWTRFTPDTISNDQIKDECKDAVKKIIGNVSYRIHHEETADIPMAHLKNISHRKNYIHAGVAGGCAKASTGYAFQASQKWARLCAQSIEETGKIIPPGKESGLSRWMDRIFLLVLTNYPALGPTIKMRLARHLKPEVFIRFMRSQPRLLDNLQIVYSQPFWPFLKTALKDIVKR